MGWKFWEKNTNNSAEKKAKKLGKPRELPDSVGKYMVVSLHHDPDWVWSLKCVINQRQESKYDFDIRVFDERAALENKISIKGYDALDEFKHLILFEGRYNKDTGAVDIVD